MEEMGTTGGTDDTHKLGSESTKQKLNLNSITSNAKFLFSMMCIGVALQSKYHH